MKKLLCVFMIFCTALCFLPTAQAADADETADSILSCILKNTGEKDAQAWLDKTLSKEPCGTAEWYVMALRQNGGAYDFTSYRSALEKYAESGDEKSLIAALRISLTLTALKSEIGFISETAARSEEADGIMEYVYLLHLYNNGIPGDKENIIEKILSSQLPDGGWTVIGATGDIDTTAMTLQALAPMYGAEGRVTAAADRALTLISSRQNDGGGFVSMGAENPESCAQVLTALSCLGIDCANDERFIKNGCTVIDAMLRFRLPDGSFTHDLRTKKSNAASTVQAFYALTAYKTMQRGGSYYIFDTPLPDVIRSSAREKPDVKIYLYIGVAAAAAGLCIAAYLAKKREKRTYIFILSAAAALCLLIAFVNIESPESYYSSSSGQAEGSSETYIIIRRDIGGQEETMLGKSVVMLAPSSTAYDQLSAASKKYRFPVSHNGSGSSAYIDGISGVFERDCGELSGWTYRVNGETPGVGCGEYSLREGDNVEWIFTDSPVI